MPSPVRHSYVSQQNPQSSRAVQSPQVRLVEQGSLPAQVVPSQSQSPQLPTSGPLELPLAHVLVLGHHPQSSIPVHELQSVALAHGSGGGAQMPYQSQSPQLPTSGPAESPSMHVPVPAHQPQSSMSVQLSQSLAPAQSEPPPHDEGYQSQSPQLAPLGPLDVPVAHVPVDAHHPHAPISVQSPQLVALAQGSAASVRHVPSTQLRPEQQSESAVQVWEPLRHVHRPALQLIEPQQSASPVQVPDDSTQQLVVVGDARQLSPVQQSVPWVHALRAGPQLATGRHVPLSQLRPLRQAAPVSQHASPSPPQIESHVPPVQVLAHAMPHPPQLRASVWRLAQVPEQQPRPASHTLPEQQLSPLPPHASATVWQLPSTQLRPSLHAVPPQHAWRAPPHASTTSQTPALQARPDAHAPPEQHG